MGAFSWSRDKAGSGGKTHVAGAPVVLPNPDAQVAAHRPSKKPRVWKRETGTHCDSTSTSTHAATPSQQNAHPGGPPCVSARPANQTGEYSANLGSHQIVGEAAAAAETMPRFRGSSDSQHAGQAPRARPDVKALRQQEKELEALRQKIAAKQAQVQQQAAGAARAAELAGREQQKQQRRQRLEAGFAQVIAEAKQAAAAEIAARRTAPSFATGAEVQRVLGCRTDYEVLQLQPGADAAAVRRRYKEMAVALHPDKCRAERATDAFQRLVHAYQNLLRFAR